MNKAGSPTHSQDFWSQAGSLSYDDECAVQLVLTQLVVQLDVLVLMIIQRLIKRLPNPQGLTLAVEENTSSNAKDRRPPSF